MELRLAHALDVSEIYSRILDAANMTRHWGLLPELVTLPYDNWLRILAELRETGQDWALPNEHRPNFLVAGFPVIPVEEYFN